MGSARLRLYFDGRNAGSPIPYPVSSIILGAWGALILHSFDGEGAIETTKALWLSAFILFFKMLDLVFYSSGTFSWLARMSWIRSFA